MSDFSHGSTLLQHGALSRWLTLSYSHTIVATRTHTVHSHPCFTIAQYTHEQTPLWQIWHPPPVVTFLHPPPLSIKGAIPVAMGCARCGKVLKSRRLFPVNSVWSLYVVVQMFWGEVCRRRRVARYNNSERAAAGGAGKQDASARRSKVTPPASYSLS